MTEISFYKFKKDTHHKRVKYSWKMGKDHTNYDDKSSNHTFSYTADKFYANPYKTHKSHTGITTGHISMPRFGLSDHNEMKWEQLSDDKYQVTSKYGKTNFLILPPLQ